MDVPHFIYPSSVGGHLHCLHLVAVVNRAAMNMTAQDFEYLPSILWSIYLEVELSGHLVVLYFTY